MSGSLNEDQDSRKTAGMEESNAMTIEFLRARLLSERSVSKSARQRADELAKRVAELEEELQFVSYQRKKAEKATADVLAILENRGISDVSEEFDSNSDKDESSQDFKSSNGSLMTKEISTNSKPISNEGEAYSSSEIESSPSTGRSLAWKSAKDSQHSLEKKKYMESVRRRANFASNSSSARRIGKSCRRIRRRETRSTEELQNNGTEKASCSIDASNCSDGEPVLREGSGYDNGKHQLDSTAEGSHSETQKSNGHYYSGHERDEDMESALQHQAQLIGRYEEEEKAQREWEEKFRENNNCPQESYDPGNHSDVTEERYEMEAPKMSFDAGTLNPDNQETKQEPADAGFSEEPRTCMNLIDTDKGNLQEEKCNGCVESSALEFSFPVTKEKNNLEISGRHPEASELRHQPCLPLSVVTTHPSVNISPHFENKSAPSAIPGTSSSLDLAVVPRDASDNLTSVLEALQQARLSLNKRIHNVAPLTGQSSGNAFKPSGHETLIPEGFKVPVVPPGLFRLPTDAQFDPTALVHSSVALQSSPVNFVPEIAPSRFLSEPLVDSRTNISSSLFHTTPNRSPTLEIRSGAPQRSFSQPRISEGGLPFGRTSHLDPYMSRSPAHPSVADTYPYLPDITFRLPLNEERKSQIFPSSETGMPPITGSSSYHDRFRSNMHYR